MKYVYRGNPLRLGIIMAVFLITGVAVTACGSGKSKINSKNTQSSSTVTSAVQSSSPASSTSSQPQSAPDPDNDPLYQKAYNYYSKNEYDQAIAVCNTAIGQDPNCFWAYNIKGIATYFANGNSYANQCLTLIEKSVAIQPGYAYGYFNEALIYKGLKNFDKSIECFNKDLEYKPNDEWAYFGISTIYADTDQIDQSLQYLRKAIEINPSVKETARTESHFIKMHNNGDFQALVN